MLRPGEAVEILEPPLYQGKQGRLLQPEGCPEGTCADRWLVLVALEQETLILSLAPDEFCLLELP